MATERLSLTDWFANDVFVSETVNTATEKTYVVVITTIECFSPVPLIEFGFGERSGSVSFTPSPLDPLKYMYSFKEKRFCTFLG